MARGGFSMLEMVVAGALLAISVLSVTSLIPTGMRSLKQAQDVQAASTYATELVEDAVNNFPTPVPSTSLQDRNFTVTLNGTRFQATRTLTYLPIPNSTPTTYRIYEIQAQLSRLDGPGQPVQYVTRHTVRVQ